jgi:hypothetical protein
MVGSAPIVFIRYLPRKCQRESPYVVNEIEGNLKSISLELDSLEVEKEELLKVRPRVLRPRTGGGRVPTESASTIVSRRGLWCMSRYQVGLEGHSDGKIADLSGSARTLFK